MPKNPKKHHQKNSKKRAAYDSMSPIITLLLVSFLIGGFYFATNNHDVQNFFDKIPGQQSKQEKTEDLGKIPLSQVLRDSNKGLIDTITVEGGTDLHITYKEDKTAQSQKEAGSNIIEMGVNPQKADIQIQDEPFGFVKDILISLLPFVLILLLLIFLMRKTMGGGSGAGSFMQGWKDFDKEAQKRPQTKFDEVAGAQESKEELIEVVDFLKHGQKYQKMGAKIPHGVLLYGPPGTGKTLIAKAVAGEASVPFYHMAGSEFEEMFVGVGASRVRDLFTRAKKNAPSIIFIDELDAVGKKRQGSTGSGSWTSEQTLNQILVEMDGFGSDENVIVMAATNRPEVLDPALLRPGRFDRRVAVELPNIEERAEIFKVHMREKPMDPDLDVRTVARSTSGFSGADIQNMMNEAAILATKHKKSYIDITIINTAIEKVVIGLAKKSRKLSEDERTITAYHEAGHAITAYINPKCEPVHKISIVSRGGALGVTWSIPEADRHLTSKEKFEEDISHMLGGRAAEEIIFGSITTGASNDIAKATQVAREMVMVYGMSKLKNLSFGNPHETTGITRSYSDATAQEIDHEVKLIIDDAYERALSILSKHKDKLQICAQTLLKTETIEAGEFKDIMEGKQGMPEEQAEPEETPEEKAEPKQTSTEEK